MSTEPIYQVKAGWTCPVSGCGRTVTDPNTKSGVFLIRGHVRKHHPHLNPSASFNAANGPFNREQKHNRKGIAHTLVGVTAVAVPHGHPQTIGLGTFSGGFGAFRVDAECAVAMHQTHTNWRMANPGQGTRAEPMWVADPDVIVMDAANVTVGQYVGPRLQVPGRKPTLLHGQGLILLGTQYSESKRGHAALTVVYDPTDPLCAECEWAPGTKITDVLMADLNIGTNWREGRPK